MFNELYLLNKLRLPLCDQMAEFNTLYPLAQDRKM